MNITFAIYHKLYPKKTCDPLILKVLHTFMILFFFSLLGSNLRVLLQVMKHLTQDEPKLQQGRWV
jgi:hypothetical protein